MNKAIIETDFEKAKKWTTCLSLGDDMLLVDHLAEAPFPTDARRMNFILICLCTRGSVTFTLDMQEQQLSAGNLMIVSERHILDNYCATPDFDGLCMMLSTPFYNDIIHNVSDMSALFLFVHNHPILEVSNRDQEVFSNYYHVIKTKMTDTDNYYRRDLVRTLTLAMFYDLGDAVYRFQHKKDMRMSRADIIFTQFIKMVEVNCKRERRVSWYAQQLNITPKYLSEMVKKVSKLTPNEWIDKYVTLELRIILKNSTKNIKDIANEMNFPNQSFLGKYFKEHVGMSPSEYRKS
jgi:AraC-like DNA-binding protein